MAISRREEERALDADEKELVGKSHHPEVQELSDAELADLVKLLRTRRDKARDVAHQRRREIRGKGAPRGATPSSGDAGSRTKLAVLAMAMRRLNAEAERRRQMTAQVSQAELARNALKLKQGAGDEGPAFNSRTAHKGMRSIQNEKARSLVRPMELGRQRKAAQKAQAKRDAR